MSSRLGNKPNQKVNVDFNDLVHIYLYHNLGKSDLEMNFVNYKPEHTWTAINPVAINGKGDTNA